MLHCCVFALIDVGSEAAVLSSSADLLDVSHICSVTFPAYFDSRVKDDLVS